MEIGNTVTLATLPFPVPPRFRVFRGLKNPPSLTIIANGVPQGILPESGPGDILRHVGRQRRRKGHPPRLDRMPKREAPRVEHLPLGDGRQLFVESALPVNLIPDYGSAERSHVDAYLMGPPRLDSAFYQRMTVLARLGGRA